MEFDDSYKKSVFGVFTSLFTDMEISQHSEFVKGYTFIDSWKLDLGAGDILKQSSLRSLVQKDSESNENNKTLPPIKHAVRTQNKPAVLKVTPHYKETSVQSHNETIPGPEEVQNKELLKAKHNEIDSV